MPTLEESYDDLMHFLLIKKHENPALFLNKLKEIKGLSNMWKTIRGDAGECIANTSVDILTIAGGDNIVTTIVGDTLTIDGAATLTGISEISSPVWIDVKPSGDNDDYIQFLTVLGVPEIKTVGGCDLKLNPASGELDLNAALIKNVGTVDGIDISAIAFDNMPVVPTGDVSFNSQNITNVGNVDGVDISAIKLNSMPSAANGDIDCNTQAITNVGNVDGVDVSAIVAFTTISCPAGTNPVADLLADTLNITATGDITITGNAGTDTIDFSVTKYTDAEAVAAVAAADNYITNNANDVMTGDLTVNNLITAGNVDGVDISALLLKTTKVGDLGDIWTKVTKIGNTELDLSALAQNIVFTGAQTVDGIDISAISLNSMPTACGGDVDINNHGINNVDNLDERVYYVATDAELDNAIADITTNACAGRIIITDSLSNVQATINAVNSSFIIEGNGDKTVLDANGDNTVFTITNCISCVLRDFKIDATDLITGGKEIIDITEASNNKVVVDNVTISGDNANGYGIEINSNNCVIRNCHIFDIYTGIRVIGDYNTISGNSCNSSAGNGITIRASSYCIISNNKCNNNGAYGIYLNDDGTIIDRISITGNVCNSNIAGINTNSGGGVIDYITISGNVCNNNTMQGINITPNTHYWTITGNNCNNNTAWGIVSDGCSESVFSGNNCSRNGLNYGFASGGIFIDMATDRSTITGNICNDCQNAGVGTGYGINIGNAGATDNTVIGNTALGNDTNFNNIGTNTFYQTSVPDPLNNFIAGAG